VAELEAEKDWFRLFFNCCGNATAIFGESGDVGVFVNLCLNSARYIHVLKKLMK
jgi:hypothetical protein